MPLTQEQLDTIKAANHAKSQAWEAATFTDGDRVLSHGLTVSRCGSTWTDDTGRSYETLSRWIRHKLGRRSYDVKTGAYFLHGRATYPLFLIPPVTERMNYQPWNPASTQPVNAWFLARRQQTAEEEAPAPAPAPAESIKVLEERIKALEDRLLAVAAVAAHCALFKERIETLEAK
jgi:hypothetical protein